MITLASQTASSNQHTSLPKIVDVTKFCEPFPITSLEHHKYPELILYLFTPEIKSELSAEFKKRCHEQFKHERWDCKNIDTPLLKATSTFLTLGEYCIYMVSVCMLLNEFKLRFICDHSMHNYII